jgi:hypothetical protein
MHGGFFIPGASMQLTHDDERRWVRMLIQIEQASIAALQVEGIAGA